MMIKRLSVVVALVILVSGCISMGEIKDEPMWQASAYTGGRGAGVAVYELSPDSISALEERYDRFYTESSTLDLIPPEMTIELTNDLFLILAREIKDPYMVIQDFVNLLEIFGAQFVGEGIEARLESIQEIPRNLFVRFGRGWDTSIWMMETLEGDND
jgi:hypothetical protein